MAPTVSIKRFEPKRAAIGVPRDVRGEKRFLSRASGHHGQPRGGTTGGVLDTRASQKRTTPSLEQ